VTRHLPLLIATAALVAVPAAAQAASVSVRSAPADPNLSPRQFVVYDAAPGEVNKPTVTYTDLGLVVTISDPAATLTATAPCVAVDAHNVRCEITQENADDKGSLDRTELELGDGADTLASVSPRALATQVIADGGAGDDQLISATGPDVLRGGGGIDTLSGGPGPDTMSDTDEAGALDADTFDGGTGSDTVDYNKHTAPVTATIGGTDGDDTLTGVERVVGGSGNDVLTGDDDKQTLVGNSGDDTLVAKGGNDTLEAGPGDDDLQAGAGDDKIDAGFGGTDTVVCDEGNDLLFDSAPTVVVGADCESLRFFDDPRLRSGRDAMTFRPTPTRTTRSAVTFSLHCPRSSYFDFGESNPCRGKILLRELEGAHRVVGTAKFRNRGVGRDFEVRVKLTKAGKALVSEGGLVAARLRGRGSSPGEDDGGFPDARWALRLAV
jgi:hypothetical protein